MNIYLERLAVTIYIIVAIALIGLGVMLVKCLQLVENREFLRLMLCGYCRKSKVTQQMGNGQNNA